MLRGTPDIVTDIMLKKYNKITRNKYMQLMKVMFTVVCDYLIDGGLFTLPCGAGTIGIYQKQIKAKRRRNGTISARPLIDFGATNKLRKQLQPTWTIEDWKKVDYKDRPFVLMDNKHSEDYIYITKWTRGNANYLKDYSFIPNRLNLKRKLAKVIKERTEDNKVIYMTHKEGGINDQR